MTKWPDELSVRETIGNSRSFELGYNKARTDCIEAEKNGRKSVKEIAEVACSEMLKNRQFSVLNDEFWLKVAVSIHTFLYGDTKPDERKGEGKGKND